MAQTPDGAIDGLKPLEVIERDGSDHIWSTIIFPGSDVPSGSFDREVEFSTRTRPEPVRRFSLPGFDRCCPTRWVGQSRCCR